MTIVTVYRKGRLIKNLRTNSIYKIIDYFDNRIIAINLENSLERICPTYTDLNTDFNIIR